MRVSRVSIALVFLLAASLISLSSEAAPRNKPGGRASEVGGSGAGGGGASVKCILEDTITLVAEPTSCEAPCTVDFYIDIQACQIGNIQDYFLFCYDDPAEPTILVAQGNRQLEYITSTHATLQIDGVCQYDQAGPYSTPQLFYNYRAWDSAFADVTVTEPTGSISVDLVVEPSLSTETVDLTMTATVTGEDGDETVCKFWHDCANNNPPGCTCDAAGIKYDESGTCSNSDDNPGYTAAPGAAPNDTGVAEYTGHTGATDGAFTAAVACSRDGQEAIDFAPYEILPDTINVVGWACTPAQGVVADMGTVECTAEFYTSCDDTGTFDIGFDATDNGGFEEQDLGLNIADYSDEDGLVTWEITPYDYGALWAGPGADTFTAEVTIDCENAAQVTRDFDVVVEAAPPTETFWFRTGPSPKTCSEDDCVGRDQWLFAIDGTATGDVTNLSLYCGNGAPEPDYSGLGPFTPNTDPAPKTTESFMILQADGVTNASCDYTTDGTYTQYATATRDGVTHTSSGDDWVVDDVPSGPLFSISQKTHNVTVIVGDAATQDPDFIFDISNSGEDNLVWADNASESKAWLECAGTDSGLSTGTIASGASEEITCTSTTTAMTTGTYDANVTYTDDNALNSPQVVYFSVTVIPEPGDSPIHPYVDLNGPAADQGDGTSIASGPSPYPVSFSVANTENHLGSFDTTDSTWHEDSDINLNFFNAMHYAWDFGDGAIPDGAGGTCVGSGTWTPTGNSRNNMTGPLAAHVYEPEVSCPSNPYPHTCLGSKPCRKYYPSLTVTDQADPPNYGYWTGEIHVYDPDGGY
jgi:hypothetical protein